MILNSNNDSSPGTRRERERELRRRAILETARTLFAREGYTHTSMSLISRQAEFGIGTIYQFFPSKPELFAAVVLEGVEALLRQTREQLAGASSWQEQLQAFVRHKLTWVQDNPDFYRLLLELHTAPLASSTHRVLGRCREVHAENLTLIKGIFDRANALGQSFQPELMAVIIMGTLNAIACDHYLGTLTRPPLDYLPGILAALIGRSP